MWETLIFFWSPRPKCIVMVVIFNQILYIEGLLNSSTSFLFLIKRKITKKTNQNAVERPYIQTLSFKISIFASRQGAKHGLLPFWVFMFSHGSATRSTVDRLKALKIKGIVFFFCQHHLCSWPYAVYVHLYWIPGGLAKKNVKRRNNNKLLKYLPDWKH